MPHSAAQTGVKKEGAVILRQRCLYLLQFSFFLSHLRRIRQFLLQYWPLLPGRSLKVSSRLRLFLQCLVGRLRLQTEGGAGSAVPAAAALYRACGPGRDPQGPPRAAQFHFCASARWSVTRRAAWGTKCRVASRFLADLWFFMPRRLTMSAKCRVASANSMIVTVAAGRHEPRRRREVTQTLQGWQFQT